MFANLGRVGARSAVDPLPSKVKRILQKYGSDAHLYLPGIGVINGFTAGNYFDSAGTTLASTDSSVGLVLDAAGSVGAEVTVGGDFSSAAQWSSIAGFTVASGSLSINAGGGAITNNAGSAAVIGKTYKIDFDVTQFTSGQIKAFMGGQGGVAANAVGHYTSYVVATTADKPQIYVTSGGTICQVDNLIVKEVTGIHATQSTPGFKPTLRKGVVNLLTWSNDLTNAVWVAGGGASKSGQGITLSNTYASNVQQSYSGVVGGTYTAAFALSGIPGATVAVRIIDLGGAYPATTQNVTLTSSSAIYTVTRAGTTLASIGIGVVDNGAATAVNFHGAALFQGTLTAAQILAAGGIPLTTTAPASSQAGVNYLEFGGDDYLSLPSPLFQMSDDHCVVIAFTPQNLQANFAYPSGVAGNTCRYGAIGTTSGSNFIVEWYDGTNYVAHQTPCVLNEPVVITAWKSGNTLISRKNGVQFASGAAFTTAVQATLGEIGRGALGTAKGKVFSNPVVKGTITLADVQLLEKQAASLAGIQL